MPSLVYALALLLCCYFFDLTSKDRKIWGAFTLLSVAFRESVAFSFKVTNLSLKSFALPFSVF